MLQLTTDDDHIPSIQLVHGSGRWPLGKWFSSTNRLYSTSIIVFQGGYLFRDGIAILAHHELFGHMFSGIREMATVLGKTPFECIFHDMCMCVVIHGDT